MATPPTPAHVRAATPADAATLTMLGRRTFSDAFGDANDPHDLAQFLDGAYTAEIQARELADPFLTYLLAEHDGAPVGFALLRRGKRSEFVADPTAIELQRFYVDRAQHGRGIAPSLMHACIATAQSQDAATMWLGVWEQNPRAIRFYQKHGFTEVGRQIFVVGSDEQHDLVLARSLTTASSAA
jgi:diamine N-acetyltransferase